jgi:hypothetical protein
MRETRIEKEVENYATNLANKTKCMSTNAKRGPGCMKRYGSNFLMNRLSSERKYKTKTYFNFTLLYLAFTLIGFCSI